MKKSLLCHSKPFVFALIFLCGLQTRVNAQSTDANEPAFKKGSKTLGLAAGLGVEYGYYSGYKSLPAFTFIYDQGFFEELYCISLSW
jgi:hypothetical protein